MKYFLIKGKITNPQFMTDDLMKEHQAYTGKAMAEGRVLFSSLTEDMTASVTVVRWNSRGDVEEFYENEPFYKNNILVYEIDEINMHYHRADFDAWLAGK